MDRPHSGFTLVELMIVVAIVGILSAIALSSYREYRIRASMTEAIGQADACKSSVLEYFATRGAWPADVGEAGCGNNIETANVVSSLTVNGSGAITVGIYGHRTGIGAACAIVLAPDANGTAWTGSSTCPAQYVPANFR